jgi:hydroxymethylpyrimidine pyrophosphatase-like HAD family hydrolase
MDFYLNTDNSSQRLLEEYRKYGTLVVAFDFDDTVYDFHKKGRLYKNVIKLLQDLKSINCYLICWTGQENEEFVKGYLNEKNIPFDCFNENPPFHKSTSRKIYANAYLDDRAGLKQVFDELNKLVQTVKTKNT